MKIFTFLRTLFKSPYQYELRFFLPEKIRTQLNIVSIKNLTTFFQEKEIPFDWVGFNEVTPYLYDTCVKFKEESCLNTFKIRFEKFKDKEPLAPWEVFPDTTEYGYGPFWQLGGYPESYIELWYKFYSSISEEEKKSYLLRHYCPEKWNWYFDFENRKKSQIAERWLSGNVVEKENALVAFLENHPNHPEQAETLASLQALREVTPQPIAFEELDFNLGERWFSKEIYSRFASHLFQTDVTIHYNKASFGFDKSGKKSTGEITRTYFIDEKGNEIKKISVGDTIRVCIDSKGEIADFLQYTIYEKDKYIIDDIIF